MTEWEDLQGLNTRVGAPAAPFELDPEFFTRKRTRSMGRVAQMAVKTARDALRDANLLDSPEVSSPLCGVSFGSSAGQPRAVAELAHMILTKNCRGITATTYVRMMSHTAPVNISVAFGARAASLRPVRHALPALQGIGSAYEAIASGRQTLMIAGGCEELDATDAASADTLLPPAPTGTTIRRIPLVLLTDAATALLSAKAPGALILEGSSTPVPAGRVYAEILGYGTNADGEHITSPASEQMAAAMRLALDDAGLAPKDIDLINGHGTATDRVILQKAKRLTTFSAAPFPIPPTKATWDTRSEPAVRWKRFLPFTP